MTQSAPAPRKPVRSREDKYDERRTQLAESALTTLGELGYARTSLREIAHNSEFSHGVVHYYFNSKADLILHCVRHYKTQCARRYDEVVATSDTSEDLVSGFIEKLLLTLNEDAPMHRLWYDLRGQSMFEREFAAQVNEIDSLLEDMIWRIVARYAELTGDVPRFDRRTTYAMIDGLFQQGLLAFVHGEPDAATALRDRVLTVLPALFEAREGSGPAAV